MSAPNIQPLSSGVKLIERSLLGPCQLPECMGDGETPQRALDSLQETIGEWLISAKENGWQVPAPDSLEVYKKIVARLTSGLPKFFSKPLRKPLTTSLNKVVPRLAQKMAQELPPQGHGRYQSATFVYRGAPDEELV